MKMICEEVIDKSQDLYGLADEDVIQEIVWQEPNITIRTIQPTDRHHCLTLFTTGMSYAPMSVAAGEEAYQFAELFIQLPPGWPIDASSLGDPDLGWPVFWLQNLARFPHLNNTSPGGPVAVISDPNSPAAISPNNDFTAMLMLAEHVALRHDDLPVQLYRLMPLYKEEVELEAQSVSLR